jgi:hypothetical protein
LFLKTLFQQNLVFKNNANIILFLKTMKNGCIRRKFAALLKFSVFKNEINFVAFLKTT